MKVNMAGVISMRRINIKMAALKKTELMHKTGRHMRDVS
jgi:hypothetical protein